MMSLIVFWKKCLLWRDSKLHMRRNVRKGNIVLVIITIHHMNCDLSVFFRVTSVNCLGHDVGTSSASILEYKLFVCNTVHNTQICGRKHISNFTKTLFSHFNKSLRVDVDREAHLRILARAVSTSLLLTDLMGPRPVAAGEEVSSAFGFLCSIEV